MGTSLRGITRTDQANAARVCRFCLPGKEIGESVVRAEGFEPSQALRPNGFSYQLRLSPPPSGVCGLDYPFTLPRQGAGA